MRRVLAVAAVTLLLASVTGCNKPENSIVGVWSGSEEGSTLSMNADGTWVHDTLGGVESGTYTYLGDGRFALTSNNLSSQFMEVVFTLDGDEGQIAVTGDAIPEPVQFEYLRSEDNLQAPPSTRPGSIRLTVSTPGADTGEEYQRVLLLRSWAFGFSVQDFTDGEETSFTLTVNSRSDDLTMITRAATTPGVIVIAGDLPSSVEADSLLSNEALEGALVLSGNVDKAQVTEDDWGSPVIQVRLSGDMSSRLEALTQENVGHQVAVVMDGVVKSAPTVTSPIANGELQLSPGDAQDAAAIAALLKTGALPGNPEIVDSKLVN